MSMNLSEVPTTWRWQKTALCGVMVAAALALTGCSEQAKVEVAKTEETKKVVAKVEAPKAEKAAPAKCGQISIANMTWQSATLLANIDKFALEHAYGCDVSLVPGDTVPTTTSMSEKSKPDIAPELWTSAVKDVIKKPIAEGRLVVAGYSLKEGGVEAWWIPQYIAEAHPEIKTIEDALNHPELFKDPDDASKGAVYGCPSGWTCQITTGNIFKASSAKAKGFRLVDPGAAAGLDGSIAKAYERKEGWLGYYWSPTLILGKYPMKRLDAGVAFSQEEWDRCTTKVDCVDPKPNDYSKSEVVTLVTKRVSEEAPLVMSYLKNRSWVNSTIEKVLFWMGENQASGEDGARYFFKEFPEVWSKWVEEEQANKIKAALK